MSSHLRVLCLGPRALDFVRSLVRDNPGELDAIPLDDAPGEPAGGAASNPETDEVLLFSPDDLGEADTTRLWEVRARRTGVALLALVPDSGTEDADGLALVRRGADGLLRHGTGIAGLRQMVARVAEARRRDAAFLNNTPLLQSIWPGVSELIALMRPDSAWEYANPAHRRMLGDPLPWEGGDLLTAAPPPDREGIARIIRDALEGRDQGPVAIRLLLPDGSSRQIEARVSAVRTESSGPAGLLLLGRDVTDRHQAEGVLREREEFFRRISEDMTDLVAVLDPEGRRLYNSPSYRALFGGHPPELGTDSFAEIHPEDRERIREVFRASVASGVGQRAEFRFVLPDGRVRYLESVGSVVRDQAGKTAEVIVVSRDTTDRRQALEALSRERNLLRTLIDALPDFIYAKDEQGRFILNNVAHARLIGAEDPAALTGRSDFEVFPPEDAARYAADDMAVVRHGKPVVLREEPVRERDGREIWCLTTKVPLRDDAGRIVGLVGMSRDITGRRRVEQDLRESQERLELVIAGSRDGVWDWNVVTNEVYFSPRWKGMLGYADDEVENTFEGWLRLLHPDDREQALQTLQAYFDGRLEVYELEHRLRHKDGSYRWILARGVVLRDANRRPLRMAGSHVDLTERRRTEQRLREAARWESVTTLAAGVAHEVKNPLQTILLGVDFLARRPGADDPVVAELLARMHNAARHADTVIRALRDYALQREPQLRRCDLNELIRESRGLLDFELGREGIEVRLELQPDLPALPLDVEQVKQACLSVFRNAMDAMAGTPGRITVTSRFQLHPPEIPSSAPPPVSVRGWVVVSVDDTGPGVPAEVLPRAFDLFFTTKTPGKGTGIGLALARRFLELHRGAITLSNLPAGGARVTFALPVTPESTTPSASNRLPAPDVPV